MLYGEQVNLESEMRVGDKDLKSEQGIHLFGIVYLCNFLDRVGFTILEVNTEPHHHYQILARINEKSLMIAVRTACNPDIGTIDSSTSDRLIRESEELHAIPHFAPLSIKPLATNNIEVEGNQLGQEYKVIFNGIHALHKSESLAKNN